MKYIPNKKHIRDGFYAVKETNWIPVNHNGQILQRNQPCTRFNGGDGYVSHLGIPIHRIVALTFLECPGNPDDYMVNHINGIKDDNRVVNLEWCTPSENSLHAYKTGLRSDNRPIEVKDLLTGEIIKFYSLTECARWFKINQGILYSYLNRNINRPFKRKYDVRYEDCNWKGWTYDDVIDIEENGNDKLIIAIPDDSTKKSIIFQNMTMVSNLLNISLATVNWYLNSKYGKNQYAGYSWYYLRDYSKIKKERDEIIKASEIRLHERVKRKPPTPRVPSKIKVTDLTTDEETIWNSLQEYAESLGYKKNTLEKLLKARNYIINGKLIEYLNKTKQYR